MMIVSLPFRKLLKSESGALTLDEKSAKSSSLAIRRLDEAARRANVGEAGWNAEAYFRADIATVASIVVEKGAMITRIGNCCKGLAVKDYDRRLCFYVAKMRRKREEWSRVCSVGVAGAVAWSDTATYARSFGQGDWVDSG